MSMKELQATYWCNKMNLREKKLVGGCGGGIWGEEKSRLFDSFRELYVCFCLLEIF